MRRDETLVTAYIERLKEEATQLYQRFPHSLETLYFGGGTPSHLKDSELEDVINHLQNLWGKANLETTLEADPLTFDKSRLEFLRQLGITRLSIGLQSTQDHVLKFLGRVHNGKQGLEAVSMALAAGFEVSADLITGITQQDTAKDLHALAQTGINHISVYSLTIEPFTPFALRNIQSNQDKDADDYELTQRLLSSYGFEGYEVSNHAKPGHQSKHNQVYWHGDYFLALGPSAASFIPANKELIGIRSINPPIKHWLQHQEPERIAIDKQRYLEDLLLTALRTKRGLNLDLVRERTNIDMVEFYGHLLPNLLKEQWLLLEPPYLKASPKGLLQLNGLIKKFIKAGEGGMGKISFNLQPLS
jgi:coproporphyrinogen III oxidase-like Fe-S oxidoreductase